MSRRSNRTPRVVNSPDRRLVAYREWALACLQAHRRSRRPDVSCEGSCGHGRSSQLFFSEERVGEFIDSVENAMRDERVTDLNVIVDASGSALHVWMYNQCINAQLFADDDQLRPFGTVGHSCLFATSTLHPA